MKSQDLMNNQNNRGDMIRIISEFCDARGYSYSYTEKKFSIKLPFQEEVPITTPGKTRKGFDISTWGPDSGVHEDELKPIDELLEEGETPEETKE